MYTKARMQLFKNIDKTFEVILASAYVYVCINVTNQNLNCYNSKSYNCHMYNNIAY